MPEPQSLAARFGHVNTWVFDLDNTLYPPHCNLFAQVDQRMTAFIAELLDLDRVEARALQKDYYRTYGTTLHGLMTVHNVDPHTFLDYVHNIDHSPIEPDPALGSVLAELPGRKLIYTNGSVAHAEAVIERLGIAHHFEETFDIVAAEFRDGNPRFQSCVTTKQCKRMRRPESIWKLHQFHCLQRKLRR